LRSPHGVVTGGATSSAPATTSRRAVASLSVTSNTSRTGPDTRAPGLDPVDGRRLRLVEELQRRTACVEHNDPAVVRAPVGDLLEAERVAVERKRLLEVRHRQCHSQLRHPGHAQSITVM
jgi:hypothetical protein